MACHYFKEDHAIFCSAKVFAHVPGISEMERFCFNDFSVCPIFNKLNNTYVPIAGEIAGEVSSII
jgi:hypothetical protein